MRTPARSDGTRRRRRRRRPRVVAVALVGVLAAWSWQPAAPLDARGGRPATVLRVGESAPVPELGAAPGAEPRTEATLTVTRVDAVRVCTGRWWPGVGTLVSGPVTRLTVTATGLADAHAAASPGSWAALNAWGEAYTGAPACECDGSCEVGPRADGPEGEVTFTVLLETGASLSRVGFTGVPGRLLEWDLGAEPARRPVCCADRRGLHSEGG